MQPTARRAIAVELRSFFVDRTALEPGMNAASTVRSAVMTRTIRTLLATSLAIVVAAGCHKARHQPTSYGGGPNLQMNVDGGIARLASAKCDRQQRCNNVGPGEAYESRAQCEVVMRGKLTDDIHYRDCRGGIDDENLEECVDALREESCVNVFEKVSSHAKCRVSKLCFN